jgi:glutamate/tyrosine decarboxylase-like PLP-dependent enzyme
MAPRLAPLLAGMERADSLAFDLHKWMHVPYDAGCVLVRDGALHRAAFADRPSYLASRPDGLAGGEPWFCDFGPELSRGFRALKVWAALKAHGTVALGRAIEANCDLAAGLVERARAHPRLEVMAPQVLSIACLRFVKPGLDADALDALNAAIVAELQDGGVVAPSSTRLPGGLAIRVNITNHRTTAVDTERLIEEVDAAGLRLSGG